MGCFFLRPQYNFTSIGRNDIPVHAVPFPVNPGLHVQLYDPSVLLQKAFAAHLWTLVVHSLISERKVIQNALTSQLWTSDVHSLISKRKVKTPYFQQNDVYE